MYNPQAFACTHMFQTYGSQTPVVLFRVDPGQYAPKGHAAYIHTYTIYNIGGERVLTNRWRYITYISAELNAIEFESELHI